MAQSARVTIHVIDQLEALVVDVPALASDLDGNVTDDQHTDASGTVQVDIPTDGAVSLFLGPNECEDYGCYDRAIETIAGLEDGAEITLVTSRPFDRPLPMRPTMDLEIVLPPLPDGAFDYRVEVPCRDGVESEFCGVGGLSLGEPTVTIADYPGCPGIDATTSTSFWRPHSIPTPSRTQACSISRSDRARRSPTSSPCRRSRAST